MTDPTQNISRHTQTEPQLSASGLTLGYEGHAVAENINFQVNRGDYLCIIGENGSGKSTLIKTLLGLTPPLAGKITFGDGLSARQIGYLPQQTDFQKDFPASCEEIALSGFLAANGLRPFYSKAQKQRVEQLFAELGIPLFPAVSSNVSCWREPSVPRKKCCCSMSLSPDWTPQPCKRCIRSSRTSIAKSI